MTLFWVTKEGHFSLDRSGQKLSLEANINEFRNINHNQK
jgi:hypothetical protein